MTLSLHRLDQSLDRLGVLWGLLGNGTPKAPAPPPAPLPPYAIRGLLNNGEWAVYSDHPGVGEGPIYFREKLYGIIYVREGMTPPQTFDNKKLHFVDKGALWIPKKYTMQQINEKKIFSRFLFRGDDYYSGLVKEMAKTHVTTGIRYLRYFTD